jgi:hypothetical protein
VCGRRESAHARVLCFSRQFRRDGPYFTSIESEITQRAVIELAKYIARSFRLLMLLVARVRSPGDGNGCLDRGNDVLAEDEPAMGTSGVIQRVTRRPRMRCRVG